jgi:hypothetical protein
MLATDMELNPNNSRPFDVHRWSEFPEVKSLTKEILYELFEKFPNKHTEHKRERALRVLLIDLWCSFKEDPFQYIGIQLSSNAYQSGERYNKLHLKYGPIRECFEALVRAGYLTGYPGFRDHKTGIGRVTRIIATTKLRRRLLKAEWSDSLKLERFDDEVIILKGKDDKKIIDYVDNKKTRRMRDDVERYNRFIADIQLDVSIRDKDIPENIYLHRKSLYRVFNNGKFTQGGRFYGGWYQGYERWIRERLTLDNKETVEIDFRGLHIILAYAIVGIDFHASTGEDDPYLIKDYKYSDVDSHKYRNLIKTTFLVMLNAKNINSAVKAVFVKWQGNKQDSSLDKTEYPENVTHEQIRKLMVWIQKKHQPIAKLFNSGVGLDMQFLDSEIANRVLMKMVDEKMPVLPIHDSFVCKKKDEMRLKEIMIESFHEQLKAMKLKPVEVRLKHVPFFEKRDSPKDLDVNEINSNRLHFLAFRKEVGYSPSTKKS